MHAIRQWFEKFCEAWTACALCMVQGDLSVFSIDHALTASKTGSVAATAVTLCFLVRIKSEIVLVWLTGLLTACVDIMIHPSHFGPEWLESIVTGVGAMILAYVFLLWKRGKHV